MQWHEQFTAHDEITGQNWAWGHANYLRLEPWGAVAHIIAVRP
jgi:starch synthase (maltosyl-transferring)